MIFQDETLFDKFLDKINYYKFIVFVQDWIYPAYKLKNYFFKRYDLIKMDNVERTQFCDVYIQMFHSNMQLIVNFIQKQNPQKYNCWYKDELGVDVGPIYGYKQQKVMFEQYRDYYIMDIIKQIYQWYKVKLVQKQNDLEYLTYFYSTYLTGKMKFVQSERKGFYKIQFDKTNVISFITQVTHSENFYILNKYIKDEKIILDSDLFKKNIIDVLQKEIEMQKQKYLHLCIQVRPYLWT